MTINEICIILSFEKIIIPNWQNLYIAEYESALAEGKMDVAYSRVMLLGTAGVGKSCFKRSLMKEPWDPTLINSTILSDIDSIKPITREWQGLGSKEDEKWSIVTQDDEVEEMAELLVAVHQGDISGIKNKVAAIELFQMPSSFEASSDIPVEDVQLMKLKHVESVLSAAIERANEKSKVTTRRVNLKPLPFVHLWDCGGQPIFLEVLPAFLTARTMFLLMYDASKGLHERWKSVQTVRGEKKDEEEVNMTTLDLLLNWMTNIHINLADKDAEGLLVSYPRILCIGTHGDKLKGKFLKPDQKNAVKQEIESHCRGKPFEALIDGFYIIDNTTAGKGKNEDPSFSEIRNCIRNFTSEKLVIETPITWVLFRKVIQSLAVNTISLNEAQAIGVACKIPAAVVPKVLLYYHDIGVVLFYPHIKGLQDIIFISPQWFVNTLGKVLTLRGREEHRTRLMWDLLREKGILVQPLYVAAWREIKKIRPKALINLLVHFRLAAEVKTDQYHDIDAKQYFLPLVLPSCAAPESSVPSGYLQRATPLHITFHTGFVPPGFFTRLITSIVASSQCEIQFDKGVYRNKISFLFGYPPTDLVIIIELQYAIQVTALRYSPESDALVSFTDICQELSAFLQQSARDVDQCLFGSYHSNDEDTKVYKEVRFLCAGEECNKVLSPHYLKHKTGQTRALHLQCEIVDEYRLLLEKEGLWFPDSKTTKKISNRLNDKEMAEIASQLSDFNLHRLAAHFNMTSKLQGILSDQSKSGLTTYYFLYEWRDSKAGVRSELVDAFKELNLEQLASMVEQAEYDPELLKKDTTENIASSSQLQPPPTASSLPSSSSPTLQHVPFQSSPTSQHAPFNLQSSPTLRHPLSYHQPSPNFRHSFLQQFGTPPTSPIPFPFIPDNDLLQCCSYFKPDDINKLIGILDEPQLNLREVAQQYDDTQVKGYRILKKWLEAYPFTTKEDLQEKLKLMGFYKVTKRLSSSSEERGTRPLSTSSLTTHISLQSTDGSGTDSIPQSSIIDDNDLLRSSRYITSNISTLSGILGVSDVELGTIQQRYKDVQTQAYWLLKDWVKHNPNTTKEHLQEKLQLLGFTEAANNLCSTASSQPRQQEQNNCILS